MSGRIFQNVVLQFKDTTDRTVGVIDAEGTVIACSELTGIGKKWAKYVEAIDSAEGGCIALEGKTFKALPGWGGHFDYAVFATGDDSVGRTVCAMACVALNSAKTYYEESTTRAPSSRTSSPTTSLSATSICGPRSCTWPPRYPAAYS